jgi:hypothetical protein
MATPRMRTIDAAIKELKQDDPNCALTRHALRKMVISKRVPSVQVGNKYLVNLDSLISLLSEPGALADSPAPQDGSIRPIVLKQAFRR